MSKLVILVGIPGSGKSTWAKSMLPDFVYVSSDDIRESMGDVTDQSRNSEVFGTFHRRIEMNLRIGNDVVADSTALDERARTTLRALARRNDAEVHLVVFANLDQAVVRNAQRERVVPEHAMVRMLDKYERLRLSLAQESNLYTSITEIKSYT